MAEFPDSPDVNKIVDSAEEGRFGRIIAVAIVLVTLAAATTAWLQAAASRDDKEAAIRAERLASQSLGTLARSQALAELRVQRELQADERGRRAKSLERQRAFGVGGGAEATALGRGWRRAERATRRTTERIAAAEGIPPLEGFGRERDPVFPSAYLTAAAREAERLNSLRDAAGRESDRAEEQVGAYGVALTVFAVSVFLFGYALTPYGRPNRKLFASVAGTMAACALLWAAWNALDPPNRAPDGAAEAFADAGVAAALGQRDEAIDALDRAIELRPGYAAALTARGQARAGAADPYAEIPEPAARAELESAREDFRRAVELDSEDIDAWLGLGATELLVGIDAGDRQAIGRAARAALEAIDRDPVQPGARLLLAEASYALGQPDAPDQLADALARVAVTDDGERGRDPAGRLELLAGALFVFERLREQGLIEEQAAMAVKGSAVAGAFPDVGPPLGAPPAADGRDVGERGRGEPDPEVEPASPFLGLELDVGPGQYELSWLADSRERGRRPAGGGPPFDARTDTMAIVLWARMPSGRWVVVPEISGPVGDRELAYAPGSNRALVVRSRPGASVPPRCLPEGRYRAEVYVNGALVAAPEAGNAVDTEGAARLDDLSVLACRPAGWKPLPAARGGVVDGVVAPAGEAGLLAVRIPARAAPGRGRRGTLQALEAGFEQLEPLIGGPIESRRRVRGPFLDATTAPTLLVRTRDGAALIAAGRLSGQAIVVGGVYGPKSLFEQDPETGASEGIALFQSFSDRF